MNISNFLKVICLTIVCALGRTDVFAMHGKKNITAMRAKKRKRQKQRARSEKIPLTKAEGHYFAGPTSQGTSSDVKRVAEVKKYVKKSANNDDEMLSDVFNDLSLDTQDEDEVKDLQPIIVKRGLPRLLAAREMGKRVLQHKILDKLDSKIVREHYKIVIEKCYKDPGFMIGDWTCYLKVDEAREVVAWLKQKAVEFIDEKGADQKELEDCFKEVPENCFKMLVRDEYYNRYGYMIDDVQMRQVRIAKRKTLLEGFWAFDDHVSWCNFDIDSLARYKDVLAVWNCIVPITTLNLGDNQISKIEGIEGLKLRELYIQFNKIERLEGLPEGRLLSVYFYGNPGERNPGFKEIVQEFKNRNIYIVY